ncbi:MAG: hypothetical protein J5879_09045 [Clostridia bacterium]|nr:hypothetical protein [Clostridia bacterium]
MKKNEKIYRAIGGISDDKAADAYLVTSEKQKSHVLRKIFAGIGVAALVCSFFVLSFVLLKVSGPLNQPADGTGTETDTNQTDTTDTDTAEAVIKDRIAALIDENKKAREAAGTPEDEIDYEFLKQLVKLIYEREDTTKTQFSLLQRFDKTKYKLFDPEIIRLAYYYDDNYEKNPVYVDDKIVWYKAPYVRYQALGYPDKDYDREYVTHIDICGLDDVSICGITVNSTFEQFRETFTNLGFTVSGGERACYLPYSLQRMVITAEYNGFWIILEQASAVNPEMDSYGEAGFIQYENNTVPAILRMGVAVQNDSPVEQHDLP